MLTFASVDCPAELLATRVKVVALRTAFGVPEITQVLPLTVAHPGSGVVPDFMLQDVIAAPLADSVFGETDIATPNVPLVPADPE
jgi:hypothetical protein